MSTTSRILTALRRVFSPASRRSSAPGVVRQASARGKGDAHSETDAGRFGQSATVEVDGSSIGSVRLGYAPNVDGDPDPGEVVWTWVPYEERDGRGKDRPVILVAREKSGSLLAVQLTSKEHNGDRGYVDIGTGAWDGEGRQSWANIDRVFRVFADGMRREAASLDAARYDRVVSALRARYGWR